MENIISNLASIHWKEALKGIVLYIGMYVFFVALLQTTTATIIGTILKASGKTREDNLGTMMTSMSLLWAVLITYLVGVL